MNLIKQLGGYEKAKRELELKEQNSVLQCCSAVTAEMIRDALLEYRRQHNIFEVGDYVCYRGNGGLEAIFQVEALTPKTKQPKTLRCGRWGNYPVGRSLVNHATDAEIKAGKRLEVGNEKQG